MRRLIEKGLMFGNLVEVNSPALVTRYNRALKRLTGQTTDLTDFHIDISGFSLEVGDALGDMDYLNVRGCNRQFILLTTEQKRAPLLNARFSMSREILRDFITQNEDQLFALTARDAVFGELENSVFEVDSPAQLFDIRRVTVQADTTGNHVASAAALQEKIHSFRHSPDGWWDDVLIAEMIELARETGDVTRNPIHLSHPGVDTDCFWTAHFGGVYVFRGQKTLIAPDRDPGETGPYHRHSGANGIAHFLDRNALAEPIVQARGTDAAAILRAKIDFLLVDVAANLGRDVTFRDRRELRRVASALGSALPDEVLALADLLRWAEGHGRWPRIGSDHPAFFYTLRATPGPHRDVVNQLLAELSPKDIRQLFICHKTLFYSLYSGWPETKKAFVADFLESEYLMDKAGARASLFGPDEPDTLPEPGPEDLIARVGPWGAVRQARR